MTGNRILPHGWQPGTYEITKRIVIEPDGTGRFVDAPDGVAIAGFWPHTATRVTRIPPDTEAGTFTCPACDTTTRHPCDVADLYCPRCHWWTGNPVLAWTRPDLFHPHGRNPPGAPHVDTRTHPPTTEQDHP